MDADDAIDAGGLNPGADETDLVGDDIPQTTAFYIGLWKEEDSRIQGESVRADAVSYIIIPDLVLLQYIFQHQQ